MAPRGGDVERQFVEVIIAPEISDDAIAPLPRRKTCGYCAPARGLPASARDFKRVNGGLLVQDRDDGMVTRADLTVATERTPRRRVGRLIIRLESGQVREKQRHHLCRQPAHDRRGRRPNVAGELCTHCRDQGEHAGLEVKGAVMASDAFFPFRDGIDNAAERGIAAVIQPGGSMRDEEVIAAANEAGMAMVFTGMRHFRH